MWLSRVFLDGENSVKLLCTNRFYLFLCVSLLDENVILLLVIVQAKAVAGAKSYQFPLRVKSEGGDHSRRLALDQSKRLEAWRKQHRLLSHIQPSVALTNKKTNKTLLGSL